MNQTTCPEYDEVGFRRSLRSVALTDAFFMLGQNSHYPRPLTPRERSWLEWVLPAERAGYRVYREYLDTMIVLGEGRRGKGDFVLGYSGDVPDTTITLPPVFAYGVIETNFGQLSITVRENYANQIDVEIVSHRSEDVPVEFEERRRWTYSTWSPGDACPQCEKQLREVLMRTDAGKDFVLAICPADKRLWVYDAGTQVNHLIPITNFYNELMLQKNIRDPKVALDSNRLFSELSHYTDAELMYAFLTYNKLKMKVEVKGTLVTQRRAQVTLLKKLQSLFTRGK